MGLRLFPCKLPGWGKPARSSMVGRISRLLVRELLVAGSIPGPVTQNGTWITNITDIVIDPNGCEYCWCLELPAVGITQFMISIAVTMMAFSVCTALIASIFTKMLGRNPQGFWMGMLSVASSSARIIGPITFSAIYEKLGTYATFGILALVQASSGVFLLLSYKRLVPAEHA